MAISQEEFAKRFRVVNEDIAVPVRTLAEDLVDVFGADIAEVSTEELPRIVTAYMEAQCGRHMQAA